MRSLLDLESNGGELIDDTATGFWCYLALAVWVLSIILSEIHHCLRASKRALDASDAQLRCLVTTVC